MDERAVGASGPLNKMNKGGRMRPVVAVKILISAGILAYIFSFVPFAEIAAALSGVDPLYILLGLSLTPVAGLAAAAQQKVLTDLQGMRLSVAKIAEINLVTHFYNLFLPGYLGGLIRWHRMSVVSHKPAQALAAIAFNRMLETLTIVALGLVFWLWARPADVSPLVSLSLVAVLGCLLVAQIAVFNRRFAAWACARLEGRGGRKLPAMIRTKLAKVLTAAGVFDTLGARTVAYMVGLALIRHLLAVLALVWFALSIGISLHFAVAGWIDAFLAIVLMLPISVAGLGVREASLIVFLQNYGVSAAGALALSAILFAKKLLRAGCGALLEARHTFCASYKPKLVPGPGTAGTEG